MIEAVKIRSFVKCVHFIVFQVASALFFTTATYSKCYFSDFKRLEGERICGGSYFMQCRTQFPSLRGSIQSRLGISISAGIRRRAKNAPK